MTQIEALWKALEQGGDIGGAQRVDDSHSSDFYCSLDASGRRGLLLISAVEPPMPPPTFDAVEIFVGRRGDGRWSLGMWLTNSSLCVVFAMLCQDLVSSSRDLSQDAVPSFVVNRLLRWRRLLEQGVDSAMPISELRGLVGELVVLKLCLDHWPIPDVVEAWQGPLGAPQDFSLPALLLEVKAVRPSAMTARINSADQLESPDGRLLRLAVVVLASTVGASEPGFSVPDLIAEIRNRISGYPATLLELDGRLRAAGYVEHVAYEKQCFRVESVRFFAIDEDFPRITRSQLSTGIVDISYDIALTACTPFAVMLET